MMSGLVKSTATIQHSNNKARDKTDVHVGAAFEGAHDERWTNNFKQK